MVGREPTSLEETIQKVGTQIHRDHNALTSNSKWEAHFNAPLVVVEMLCLSLCENAYKMHKLYLDTHTEGALYYKEI